jgi:hypothetical protein
MDKKLHKKCWVRVASLQVKEGEFDGRKLLTAASTNELLLSLARQLSPDSS